MIFGILFKVIMFTLDGIFDWDFYQDWWWNLGLVVITFYVGIQGYAQIQPTQLIFATPANTRMSIESNPEKRSESEHWKAKISAFMEEQKPYLNASLTLRDLASQLHTNLTTLSSEINQTFGMNFNDFVNGYRVREFLQRIDLPEYQHFTLLALALDCGFNSKATFNRAFRKQMGVSPQEYRQKRNVN
jgi:AraC-like DNA-binding protein